MSDILHALSWYIAISFVGLAALPIGYRFFSRLPSRGIALARPLGLLMWGFIFWLLTSLGILQNDLGGVVLAFAGLIGFAIWAVNGVRYAELISWIRQNTRSILTTEILFFVLFAFWTMIRGMNPEVAYTEKPMELAFINAILRSPAFPPFDPWLSGYAISYYYFGYVLIAMLTRVTGVASAVAFNLSSALWFALTAAAAFGIVYDLVFKWLPTSNNQSDKTKSKFSLTAGFLGPLYILFVSTIEGVLEVLHAKGVFWKMTLDGNLTSKFWNWLGIMDLDQAPNLPFSWIPSRTSGWLWWRGSRVLQDLNLANERIEVIDEFPFFSYLLSDLHPHVLAMPFALLAIGVCLNFLLNANEFRSKFLNIQSWMKDHTFWLTTLILGSLAFINTWDFPIYVGLFCVVWGYTRYQEEGWSRKVFWEFLKNGLILGITGVLMYLPFYFGFASQAGGILPSLEFMTRGIHFWVLFSALLVPILAWLLISLRSQNLDKSIPRSLKIVGILLSGLFILSILYGALLFLLQIYGPELAASGNPSIASLGSKFSEAGNAFAGVHGNFQVSDVLKQSLIRRIQSPGTWMTLGLMLVIVVAMLARRKQNVDSEVFLAEDTIFRSSAKDVRVFVLILILFGIALTGFPEFFYLRDQFGWRMNTIFKFYFQGWIFWGLAAACVSAILFHQLKRGKALVFRAIWMLSLIAGLTYPVIMLSNKTNQFSFKDWDLNGNAYIQKYNPDEYAAINWLQRAPMGVIAEAVGGSYSDFARVSTRSGFPTVLGWPGHESQWRGGGKEMGSRLGDIAALYEAQTWFEAAPIIEKYQIRYIYVGNLEQSAYRVNTTKFDGVLSVAFQNQSVTIYEVPSDLEGLSQGLNN